MDAIQPAYPKVLVTGASGFVGRAVCAALAGRAYVMPALADGERADLLDGFHRRRAVEEAEADVLIHLAWVTEHGAFWNSPLNASWGAASDDLFKAFYAAGGKRIVGTGSCAEYDWTTGADRYAESAPLGPHTDYGAAKLRAAAGLARAADRAAKSWAWARIFFAFGPGEPRGRLVPLMLNAVRTREPLEIGPADTVRDFMPVGALGQAIADVALSDIEGPVNTASGKGVSFGALAQMIESIAGTAGLIRPNSRPLGPGEPRMLVADTERLDALKARSGAGPTGLSAALKAYMEKAIGR